MIDALARFLFERQANTYDATPDTITQAWNDPNIRNFWTTEAQAITHWLGQQWGHHA